MRTTTLGLCYNRAIISPDTMREASRPSNVFSPHTDRRDSPRMRPSSLMYLHLSDGRSVPIRDVSEKGLAVDTLALTDQSLRSIRFCTPGSTSYIECNGKTVWSGKSQLEKQSGIEFLDMAEKARGEIRRWISLAARVEADGDADAANAPLSDQASQSAAQESPSEVPDREFNFDRFFPSESDPSFSDLRESFPPRDGADPYDVPDPYSVSPDNFFGASPMIPAAAIEAKDADSVGRPEKIPDAPTELAGGDKTALSFSEIFGTRTSEGETNVVPRETGRDKPAAAKSSSNTISPTRPSISAPLWKPSEPKRHGRLTAWAAALGFIGGLGLASFLILGSFHFSKNGNAAHNLLQTSASGEGNNVPSDLTQSSEPSAPVQSPSASTAPEIQAAGASSQELSISDDSSLSNDTGQPPAGDVENSFSSNPQPSHAKKQITPNENLVPTESRQGNQYAQITPPANPASDRPARQAPSPPVGATIPAAPPKPVAAASAPPSADSPTPPDTQAPKLGGPAASTSAAPPTNVAANAPASATPSDDSPRQPDSQVPTLTGSVASASQFMGVQMPKTSDSGQMSGVLQIGQSVSTPPPAYPLAALQARVQGTVRLHATIGTDGSVQAIDPVSGPPALLPAAVAAVQTWKYRPTMIAGEAVPNEQNIIIVFRLSR